MKIQNLILTIVLFVIWTGNGFSQAFQQSYFTPTVDYNHFSIEQAPKGGGYICAGTLFGASNNDIYIFRIDDIGNVIWEKTLDLTADDRALDLVVDAHGNIVIAGYTSPPGVLNEAELYIAKFDLSGNLLAEKSLTGFHVSVGTNIIHSSINDTYVVGGFYGEPFAGYPMIGNEALIVEFDLNLNLLNQKQFTTGITKHSSINDIVEIPGLGYFITGSVGISSWGASQGVLATFIDDAFNIYSDLSFESTNWEHNGVSAVYSASDNAVYLMSNNSVVHNPQITTISDVIGWPVITNNYVLVLDPNAGPNNAAGFQLKQSLLNPDNLVACGYFKTFPTGTNTTTPWITEFEIGSGASVHSYTWATNAVNFHAHGGGVLSTFSGEHPYLFTQEILTERTDGLGYVFIGPRIFGGKYGIDLVTTNFNGSMPCFDPYSYSIFNNSMAPLSIYDTYNPLSEYIPSSTIGIPSIKSIIICPTMIGSAIATQTDNTTAESENETITALGNRENTMELESFTVSPNPFNSNFTILLTGENLTGSLTITNTMGQIVHQSEQMSGNTFTTEINAENFENGIYIISYLNESGVLKTKKVVKL